MTPDIIKYQILVIKHCQNIFFLFHVNIRNLTKHFGELHSFINSTKIPFDIIGITESKQTVGMDFALNVNMDGYNIHTQPTKSSHGGIAMYLKKTLDYTIRDDLSVVSDEYKTLWVEINTGSKAKNILCCCAYQHPNTDIKSFIEYMDNTLQKLEKVIKQFLLWMILISICYVMMDILTQMILSIRWFLFNYYLSFYDKVWYMSFCLI